MFNMSIITLNVIKMRLFQDDCCANFIVLASAQIYCRIDLVVTSVDSTKR